MSILLHYIVSRPKNTLNLHDISVFASLVMQWYGTSKKTCDVMYAEATPWAFGREGQGKAGRHLYATPAHTTSCQVATPLRSIGIHLGYIWDPLDGYIIILGSSMTRCCHFPRKGKTMGCVQLVISCHWPFCPETRQIGYRIPAAVGAEFQTACFCP